MENSERGKSLVNVIPRGNNVLLRMNFKASILALASGKPEEKSDEKVTYIVAGIGPLVKDLILGEEINFKIAQEYVDIPVKGNERSIKSLIDFYRSMPKKDLTALLETGDNKADVVQYGIFPEFQILAHIE